MALTEAQRELMKRLDFWKRERRTHENKECDCSNDGNCTVRLMSVKDNIHDIVVRLNLLSKRDR